MDNLRKKHVIVIDKCCPCKRNGESVDHLLLPCEVAYALWNVICSLFRLSWVIPLWVLIYLLAGGRVGTRSAVVWNIVPFCLLWCL